MASVLASIDEITESNATEFVAGVKTVDGNGGGADVKPPIANPLRSDSSQLIVGA